MDLTKDAVGNEIVSGYQGEDLMGPWRTIGAIHVMNVLWGIQR